MFYRFKAIWEFIKLALDFSVTIEEHREYDYDEDLDEHFAVSYMLSAKKNV